MVGLEKQDVFLPQELLLNLEEIVHDVGIFGHLLFRVQESATNLNEYINGLLEDCVELFDFTVFLKAKF